MADNINLRFFGIFAVLVAVILSLYFVMAALTTVTLVTPAANDNITGNYTFDATITGTSADNVTFSHNESGSFVQFCVNTTSGAGPFTCVNNTANLPDGTYYFEAKAQNDTTTVTDLSADVTVDNTAPLTSYVSPTEADSVSKSRTWIFVNVTASDATTSLDIITIFLYNSSGLVQQNTSSTSPFLSNFTGLIEGTYTYNVTVNDTVGNSNSTSSRTITLDTTAPSVSLTKTTSGQTSLEIAISGVDGTCTVDRSGATISGSTLTETGLSCGGSYTYTVTCTDSAGNVGSSSATSFSTTGCSSGGTTTTPPPKKIQSWSKMTPGVATIMKNFDPEMGIKEIKIEVNNSAQNIKITVTKLPGQPAAVSVVKTGKVYKYLQIETTNLADKLEKGTITIQVGKSWLSSNGLGVENVALFRFDDSAGQWNELPTTYTGSEGDDEIYEVELTSFSFFAISEKSVTTEDGEEVDGVVPPGEKEKRSLAWLWVLIAVVVLVGLGWRIRARR